MSIERHSAFLMVTVAASLLAACSASNVQPDVPALRTSTSSESRAEIEQTISTAMNGVPVTIADDALTEESTLLIERSRSRSIERPPEPGRSMERPQHFQLIVDARQCFLVHEETGLRWMLPATECIPE